jgi:hypothetical protein
LPSGDLSESAIVGPRTRIQTFSAARCGDSTTMRINGTEERERFAEAPRGDYRRVCSNRPIHEILIVTIPVT